MTGWGQGWRDETKRSGTSAQDDRVGGDTSGGIGSPEETIEVLHRLLQAGQHGHYRQVLMTVAERWGGEAMGRFDQEARSLHRSRQQSQEAGKSPAHPSEASSRPPGPAPHAAASASEHDRAATSIAMGQRSPARESRSSHPEAPTSQQDDEDELEWAWDTDEGVGALGFGLGGILAGAGIGFLAGGLVKGVGGATGAIIGAGLGGILGGWFGDWLGDEDSLSDDEPLATENDAEALAAYAVHRQALRSLLENAKARERHNPLVANSCEYLLEKDSRWAPMVLVKISNPRWLDEQGTKLAYLIGEPIEAKNLIPARAGVHGKTIQSDGSNRIVVVLLVDGRHGPGGTLGGTGYGSSPDIILATIVHEVQHVLDRHRQEHTGIDYSPLFRTFQSEFRAFMLGDVSHSNSSDESTPFIFPLDENHSKTSFMDRKKRILDHLTRRNTAEDDSAYPEFSHLYHADASFRGQVDDFVADFNLAKITEASDQFRGGLNLINSIRVASLIDAVEASTIEYGAGREQPAYVAVIHTLDKADRSFVSRSYEWQVLTHELPDGGSRFFDELKNK